MATELDRRTEYGTTLITNNSSHWKGEAMSPGKDAWAVEGEFLAKRRHL